MKYFTVEESICPCGCNQVIPSGHPIWSAVSHIRNVIGKPLSITSGFRCRIYNQSLPNSSPKSKHVEGCAMDISTTNLTSSDLYKFISEAIALKLRIGVYKRHVHIDYSVGEPLKFWYGTY